MLACAAVLDLLDEHELVMAMRAIGKTDDKVWAFTLSEDVTFERFKELFRSKDKVPVLL